MNSKERRDYILKKLTEDIDPQKGLVLAEELGVTRQVVVKDIAILRAEGKNIVATPGGYILPKENGKIKRTIAVSHDKDRIEEELKIIVRHGATAVDVIVEHPVYGEIKGMLMLKSILDVNNFMDRFNSENAQPISNLTGGIHIHTIEAENDDIINDVITDLKENKFLACD